MAPLPRRTALRALAAVTAAIVATLAACEPARADGNVDDAGRKTIAAVRTTTPPTIDGKLDDAAWAAAPADTRFTQFFPAEGKPPSYRTELRILYDDRALYVGVRALDDEADKIVARMTRRDRIPEADAIIVRIDSRHDHETAQVFRLHASGVQFDNYFFDDGANATPEWDAVWAGEARIDAGGWSAEYRIPLSALRFSGKPEEIWGLQVVRYISRTKETDVWSFWPSTLRGEVSHYDHIVGLRDLQPRRTFELRPYLLGRVTGRKPTGLTLLGSGAGGETQPDAEVGVDLKLGVTSDLTLDLSVNPDFGQVEADQVVLNLSRFETFFPEKRPFFLESTEIYGTPARIFYSRRIGRPPSGFGVGRVFRDEASGEVLTVTRASPSLRIWSAAKLSGKVSRRLSLGVLDAVTDAESVTATSATGEIRHVRLAPPRNFGVLRARYALGGPSYVGLMATGVTRLGGGHLYRAADDHDGYVQGFDGQWQSPGGVWRLTTQDIVTECVGGPAARRPDGTACPEGDPGCVPIARSDGTRLLPGDVGWGGTLRASRQGEHFFQDIALDAVSPKVDANDAGFLPDWNRTGGWVGAGWQTYQAGKRFQSLRFAADHGSNWDFRGNPLNHFSEASLNAQLRNFWFVQPGVGFEWPGTWDIRETTDGGRFERPMGGQVNLSVSSDSRRAVIAELWGQVGRNLDEEPGRSAAASGTIYLRVVPPLELTLSPAWQRDAGAIRFYDCADPGGAPCTIDSTDRAYRFARLDADSLSFTLSATWAFSPRVSLQTYGQLFFAKGHYLDYRAVATAGPHPAIRRRDLVALPFGGDNDGDGLKDDDFEETSLNANVVLRWEPMPGSTLFVVYTRGQRAAGLQPGALPRFHASGLDTGPTEDAVALKFVYYWAS